MNFVSKVKDMDLCFANKANLVIIKNEDGTFAEYIHLRKNGAIVKVGDGVKAGDQIAWSGNTGYSSEPHLHFNLVQDIDGKSESVAVIFDEENVDDSKN